MLVSHFCNIKEKPNEKIDFISHPKKIADDDNNWDIVDKKKKVIPKNESKNQPIGIKKEKKQEKPTSINPIKPKVETTAGEDLIEGLKPKYLKDENKPDFNAFNPNKIASGFKKNKKIKGKPQDVNIKLGFNY